VKQAAALEGQDVFHRRVELRPGRRVAPGGAQRCLPRGDATEHCDLRVVPLHLGCRRTAIGKRRHSLPRDLRLAVHEPEQICPHAEPYLPRAAEAHVIDLRAKIDRPIVVAERRRAEARACAHVHRSQLPDAIVVLRQPTLGDLTRTTTAPHVGGDEYSDEDSGGEPH